MLWSLRRCRNERQVDLALGGIGELNLRFFSGLCEPLQSLLVLT